MGRARLGERKQVNVRMPVDLVDRIDANRGALSRDAWMTKAAEIALKPMTQYRNPELDQSLHRHQPGKPLRTEFKNGTKVRIYQCATCEAEVVMK